MIHCTPCTPSPSSFSCSSNGPCFASTTSQPQKTNTTLLVKKDDVDYLLDLFDDVEAIVLGDDDPSGQFDDLGR